MVTLAKIKISGGNDFSEYTICNFYINSKQVPRKFYHLVSTYYRRKYSRGFYSREIKQTTGYFQVTYYSKKNK